MVDTLHQREAEKIGERLAAKFPHAEVGVFRVICHIGNSDA
jgi:4-hydroxy-3-methylbut-2-enyl diphosphate reductase IspH